MAVGQYQPFVKGDEIYAMDTENGKLYKWSDELIDVVEYERIKYDEDGNELNFPPPIKKARKSRAGWGKYYQQSQLSSITGLER